MRWIALGLMLLMYIPGAVRHVHALDQSLSLSDRSLQLVGQGTRTEMMFVELYRIGLYLPHDMSDPQEIQRASTPKAVRIEVRYDGSLPDRIPESWRNELMPALTQAQQQLLGQNPVSQELKQALLG